MIEWVRGSGCVCLPEKEIRFNNGDLLANTRKSTLSWQITYFSLAVIKLQGSLEKKEFFGPTIPEGGESNTAENQEERRTRISNHKQEAENELGMVYDFENSKLTPSDTPPPVRTRLLTLLRQHHRWGSNIQMPETMEGIALKPP